MEIYFSDDNYAYDSDSNNNSDCECDYLSDVNQDLDKEILKRLKSDSSTKKIKIELLKKIIINNFDHKKILEEFGINKKIFYGKKIPNEKSGIIKIYNKTNSIKNETIKNLLKNYKKYNKNIILKNLMFKQYENCLNVMNKINILNFTIKNMEEEGNDLIEYDDSLLIKYHNSILKDFTKELTELKPEIIKYQNKMKNINQLFFDITDLIKNYENNLTRYPRCHHYKNKLHSRLFTEMGDILICEECSNVMIKCLHLLKKEINYLGPCIKIDMEIKSEKIKMKQLITPPY